jgi:hypothetical protein
LTPGNLPTITSSIVVAAGDIESLDDGFDKSLTLVPHEKINVKAIKKKLIFISVRFQNLCQIVLLVRYYELHYICKYE